MMAVIFAGLAALVAYSLGYHRGWEAHKRAMQPEIDAIVMATKASHKAMGDIRALVSEFQVTP